MDYNEAKEAFFTLKHTEFYGCTVLDLETTIKELQKMTKKHEERIGKARTPRRREVILSSMKENLHAIDLIVAFCRAHACRNDINRQEEFINWTQLCSDLLKKQN